MTKTRTRGIRAVHYITLLLTTAAIILTLLAVSILTDGGAESVLPGPAVNASTLLDVPESKNVPVHTDDTAAPSAPYCTITLSGEELRLSSADAPGDYTVLDGIDPRTLRDSDREALEDGLALDSEEALVRFLEDFSS